MAEDRNLLLRLAAETGDFDSVLDRAEAKLREFGQVTADAGLNLKGVAEVNAQIDELEVKLRALGDQTFRPKVKLDVDRNEIESATKALEAMTRAQSAGGGGGGGAKDGASALSSFGAAASGAASAAMTLGIALLVLSGGGIAALVSSLGAAALGAGALGAALAGALGPAAVVALGAFQGLSGVLNFIQLDRKAQQAKQFGQANLEAAQAAQQHRTAVEGLANATQALGDAQRNYVLAVRAANDNLQATRHAALLAEQNVAVSQQDLKQATTDAYDAWKESIIGVRDALIGVENAQLGIEQSHLDLKKAELALTQFRRAAGLAGSSLDQMFHRLTDVHTSPREFQKLFGRLTASAGLNEQGQLNLQQLILNVAKAKTGEKSATDNLATSELRLNQQKRIEAKFNREGITAFAPLRAARRQLAAAIYSEFIAERDLRRAQHDGVANAPSVISASEALKNARVRLGDATRALRIQEMTAATDAQKAAQAYKALPPYLRPLATALRTLLGDFQTFGASVARAIAPALTTATEAVDGVLKQAGGSLTKLGGSLTKALGNVFTSFKPGELGKDLRSLIRNAGPMFEALGRTVGGLARIFTTIARVALPELAKVFDSWGTKANKTANDLNSPSGFQKLKTTIHGLVGAFRDWVGLFGAVGNVLLQFFTGTHGPGDNLVTQFTTWLNDLADSIHKHRGDITDFFNQTIPGLKSALGLLGTVLAALVVAFPAFITLSTPLVGALRGIANVLRDLLGTKGGLIVLASLGAVLLLRFGSKLWTSLSPTQRIITVLSVALAALGQLPSGIRQALEGIAIGLAAVAAVHGLPAQVRALKTFVGTLADLRKAGGVGAVLKRIFGFGKDTAAGKAGEGVAAGGKSAGETIAASMVEAGKTVATMLREAMVSGGAAAGETIAADEAAGGAAGGIANGAEAAAGGGLLSRLLKGGGKVGKVGRGGIAGLTAYFGSQLLGNAIGGGAGSDISKGATTAGIGAAAGAVVGGPVGAAVGFAIGQGVHAALKDFVGGGATHLMSASDQKRLKDQVDQVLRTGDPAKLKASADHLRRWALALQDANDKTDPAKMNAVADALDRQAAALARHQQAGEGAGLGKDSGLSTKIENQLRVAFNNLGTRATGGLGTLKARFDANLQQISASVPRYSRSWTRAVSQNMVSMVDAIARNMREGRIKMSDGMQAIEKAMRSHTLRGADAVKKALGDALGRIETFRQSSEKKIREAATVGRIALHRLGVGFQELKKFTDSEVTAISNLVTQAKLTPKAAADLVRSTRNLPAPATVPSSAFHHRKRHTGGPIDEGGLWNLALGEYVVQPAAVAAFGPLMDAINQGPAALSAALAHGSGAHHAATRAGTGGFSLDGMAIGRQIAKALVDSELVREDHYHLPPAMPASPQPDAEHAAAQLAMVRRRRGRR